jgi:hypothetical protein
LNTAFALESSVKQLLSYQKSIGINVCSFSEFESSVADLEFAHDFDKLEQKYQNFDLLIQVRAFQEMEFDLFTVQFKEFAEKALFIQTENIL